MEKSILPTSTGGRLIAGDTPYGAYYIEVLRDHDGPIYDADGKQLGTLKLEIREPEHAAQEALASPAAFSLKNPGDRLAFTVKKLYGFNEEQALQSGGTGCDCEKIRREMNEKGWVWCVANRKSLMARVAASAQKRNIIIDPDTMWTMLSSAWQQRNKEVAKV